MILNYREIIFSEKIQATGQNEKQQKKREPAALVLRLRSCGARENHQMLASQSKSAIQEIHENGLESQLAMKRGEPIVRM